MTASDALLGVRRRWWIVAGATVIAAAVAVGLSWSRPSIYEAEARVRAAVSTAPTGDLDAALQTEIDVLEGARVALRVRQTLGLDVEPPRAVGGVVGPNDAIVSVRVRAADPQTARTVANGYAQAYLDERNGGSIVSLAAIPSVAVDRHTVRAGLLSALAGLAVGIAGAVALGSTEPGVRTARQLADIAAQRVLALVPYDPPTEGRPVSLSSPHGPSADAYRGLVADVGLDGTSRVIQVTSPRRGDGRTTTTANLAIGLAQAGHSVVVLDSDLREPNVHELFETPRSPGLRDLLTGDSLDFVARPLEVGGGGTLALVAAGRADPTIREALTSQRFHNTVAMLAERYDDVLVDSPPLLAGEDFIPIAGSTSTVLVVVAAGQTSRRDITAALARLRVMGAHVTGLVLNKADVTEAHTHLADHRPIGTDSVDVDQAGTT